MSDFTSSANMNLPVPDVGVDPGPDWATNLNASLTIIDGHDHSPGSGVQVTPAGMNINSDLSFLNTSNATHLRSVRFYANGSPLSAGSDLGCLYESGVDLYYNDGNGNQVRITQGGSVSGSSGTITGLPSGTASAAYVSGSGTFQFLQATSTGANLDVASVAIRYPGSYPTPSGNYIQLQAPSSLASGYSLTLPALPAANNTFLTVGTTGVISSSLVVDNSTLEISSSTLRIKDLGVTAAKIASATITGTQVSSNINLPGNLVTENSRALVVCNTNPSTSLSIIRAYINASAGVVYGEGISGSTSQPFTGIYTVVFTTPFASLPTIVASPVGNNTSDFLALTIDGGTIDVDRATVIISNLSGTRVSRDFIITVIGPR